MSEEECEETVYLLDTNHCSFILEKNQDVRNKIASLPENTILTINSIIYGELLYMVENSRDKTENRDLLNIFTENLIIHSIDKETSEIYGEFRAEIFDKFAPKQKKARRNFELKQVGIYPNDLWIACTAIQHNLTIVSEDHDFKQMCTVRNIKLECWKPKVGLAV